MSMYDKVITTGGVVPESPSKETIRSNLTDGAPHPSEASGHSTSDPACYIAAMRYRGDLRDHPRHLPERSGVRRVCLRCTGVSGIQTQWMTPQH